MNDGDNNDSEISGPDEKTSGRDLLSWMRDMSTSEFMSEQEKEYLAKLDKASTEGTKLHQTTEVKLLIDLDRPMYGYGYESGEDNKDDSDVMTSMNRIYDMSNELKWDVENLKSRFDEKLNQLERLLDVEKPLKVIAYRLVSDAIPWSFNLSFRRVVGAISDVPLSGVFNLKLLRGIAHSIRSISISVVVRDVIPWACDVLS